MRLPERAPVLGGAAFGTFLGYVVFRRPVPWTAREVLVMVLGAAMVMALAFAFTERGR